MTLLALDHIQIAIPSDGEDDARAFYCGVLGLTEVERPESLAGRGGFWLESGSAKVHIGVDADFHASVKAHPAFLVTDVAALERQVIAARARVQHDVPLPGFERIHVFDPFGNRIELMQRIGP